MKPESCKRLEDLAAKLDTPPPLLGLGKLDYLEACGVIPLLLQAMAWIVEAHPRDPVESLALYLLKNNPAHPELNMGIDLSEFE